MNQYQRAQQAWSILVLCARNRQVLSYELLGRLMGVPPVALGAFLALVQAYCVLRKLPPLTALVVSDITGKPGPGFTASADFAHAQAEVFRHDWLSQQAPSPDDFSENQRA